MRGPWIPRIRGGECSDEMIDGRGTEGRYFQFDWLGASVTVQLHSTYADDRCENRCWRALEVIRKAATARLAASDEERTSHDLTEHEWGIVLSAHQNGHFAVVPSETVHVAILMGHGLLRWKTLPVGTASSICVELTPKTALLLDEGRWGRA